MRRHVLRAPLLAALLATAIASAPGARAATILIDAGNIEELVTFTFSGFDGGFSINGSTPTSGGSFTFGEGTLLSFNGAWTAPGVVPASRTVYWVEPQSPTVISEILTWSITAASATLASITGSFQAEGLGTLPPGVPQSDIICEVLDGSHDPFSFGAQNLTGQIITGPGDTASDPTCGLGGGTQVPEPSSLMLLTAAAFGLMGLRRRLRATPA